MRYLLSLSLLVIMAATTVAQPINDKPRDRAYDRTITDEKKILAYDHLREADVMWEKRIWRVIDFREKMNLPFTYPRAPFVSIVLDLIKEGAISAYVDEDFTARLTSEEIENKLSRIDTFVEFDEETFEEKITVYREEFNPEDVQKFRLKEDWIFDEETSSMVVRIIGMSPIKDVYDDNDEFIGEEPLFWIYYPECRQYFANKEVYNSWNDAQHPSWEDLFEMRIFASYIIKESNVYDRRIQQYLSGIDIILESEKIREEIRTYEHELWSY